MTALLVAECFCNYDVFRHVLVMTKTTRFFFTYFGLS